MDREKGGDSPAVTIEALKQACATYRDLMYGVCYGILGNAHDAEDATNRTIEKVLLRPPKKPVKNLVGWLRGAARFTALDMAIERQRQAPSESFEDSASPDQFRASRVRADANPFIEKVFQFLSEDIRNELGLEATTEEDQAVRFDRLADRLEEQPLKVREAVDYAGFVACLIADPGQGANLCAVPNSLARGTEASPLLLKKIKSHVQGCTVCGGKRGDTRSLFRIILLGIGGAVAIPSVLDKLWKIVTAKSSVAVAGLSTVAAGVVVVLVMIAPEPAQTKPGWAVAPTRPIMPPTATAATTTGATSTLVGPPPTTKVGPAAMPGPPPPPVPTTVPPSSGGEARDDRPPVISGARLAHNRLATRRSRCDDDAPTTSKVLVTASAVRSMTLVMRQRDRVVERPMVNVAGMWVGQVGPFSEEDAGQVEVMVRAVGNTEAASKIGTVCVTRCAGDSLDDEW